jgi:hypothetical protein
MSTKRKKAIFHSTIVGIVILSVSALVVNCSDLSLGDELPKSQNGDTRLIIGIYGSPLASIIASMAEPMTAAPIAETMPTMMQSSQAIEGIEALLLSVRQIRLRGSNGWRDLLEEGEDLVVDILAASRQDPIILSNVSVEPGFYTELRLVLNEENQIRVNGQYHPLRIPSGTASGLKLKGDFEIPRGRLFNLNVELDTARSVRWNQGQGFRLHPVLNISTDPHVLGIFRGNLMLHGRIGAGETLVQLFNDGTARIRSARFPNYTIWADYNYNSVTRILHIDNIDLDAPGLGRRALRRVMRELPDQFLLPIRQWSLDSIIVVDTLGVAANLYRVDDFNFSSGVSFTEFRVNIEHPNFSGLQSGLDWHIITEIEFIDTGMPTETIASPMTGSRTVKQILVCNNSIQGTSTRVRVTSFLFKCSGDINIEMGEFASLPMPIMTGDSAIYDSTQNSWQPDNAIFRLDRDTGGEFTVSFPRNMNIRINHQNFTNNTPVVSWDPYPGAQGYLVVAVVENKDRDPAADFFIPAFIYHTMNTTATIRSDLVSFTGNAQIGIGDFLRIEVYVLDGSDSLDTVNRLGALFRDTLTIVR